MTVLCFLELCSDTLVEEGLTEEEIEEELSVIRAQKAFVLQMLGRKDDALKIYLRVQDLKLVVLKYHCFKSCRSLKMKS